MKAFLGVAFCLGYLSSIYPESFDLSKQDLFKIGEKIWFNESKSSFEGLTHWNIGENFPSLGIAHFIWYPEGIKERFEETFPEFLSFLERKNVEIPDFLKNTKGSLWLSREDFLKEFNSVQSQRLRQFLFDTRNYQIQFIVCKLEQMIPLMIEATKPEFSLKVKQNFKELLKSEKGTYAVVDYFNFKGAGLSVQESYCGQGWGLRHVLEKMDDSFQDPLTAFIQAAKDLLKQRVENSPKERGELRWLKGWINRVEAYNQ